MATDRSRPTLKSLKGRRWVLTEAGYSRRFVVAQIDTAALMPAWNAQFIALGLSPFAAELKPYAHGIYAYIYDDRMRPGSVGSGLHRLANAGMGHVLIFI